MRLLKLLPLLAALLILGGGRENSPAQIGIGVNIGPEPVCPYGYFNYPPYDCAPYGYYGPDWFIDGVFVGVGPWFHGPHGFWGHVDNRWDPHHGYHGPLPMRGARPFENFHANEARDGRGHIGNAGHDGSVEHSGGFVGRGSPGGRR
ncbi:MAG TPA: hypothetical protein VL986_14245 [Terracidiphilus sp.]|nr:hypothetical protein [Terracidiphilus sp.]